MRMKLTKRAVANLEAPTASGKQELVWDQDLTGFGILLSGRTSAKTYVVQRSVNGLKRRITVGSVEEYDRRGASIDEARADAAAVIHDLRQGIDPKRVQRGRVTLGQALDDYLKARPNLAERSLSMPIEFSSEVPK